MHGSIYGYKQTLATPAVANGNIEFDFSLLPPQASNVVKTEVVFGLREPLTQINVDSIIFSSDTVYTFVHEGDSYRTVISESSGAVTTTPSNSQILTVPFVNFKQEKPEITEFTLPNYNYGSYYTYTFQVDGENISGIRVMVKMPEADEYREYGIEKVKYLIDPSAEVVFFNQTASDTYTLEFGSGIHGNWVTGAQIKVLLYKTYGVSANFSQEVKSVIEVPTQLVMYNKLLDGTIQSTTLDPTQYLKVNFKYSEDGKDPLAGEELRKALVKYIQTRDNFITRLA